MPPNPRHRRGLPILIIFFSNFMSDFLPPARLSGMNELRRWQIPGSVYHVAFTTRRRAPILTGDHADLISREILHLESIGGCYLLAWCVMPDHVHMLIHPPEGRISDVVKRVKGRTGKKLRKFHPDLDSFWERRFGDRRLRSHEEEYDHSTYIENNPVKEGLCENPADWVWSSAYVREHGTERFSLNDTGSPGL